MNNFHIHDHEVNNLTNSELREILCDLGFPVPEIMTRSNILDIYKKVAIPLPQRLKNKNKMDVDSNSDTIQTLNTEFKNCCTFKEVEERVPETITCDVWMNRTDFSQFSKNTLSMNRRKRHSSNKISDYRCKQLKLGISCS